MTRGILIAFCSVILTAAGFFAGSHYQSAKYDGIAMAMAMLDRSGAELKEHYVTMKLIYEEKYDYLESFSEAALIHDVIMIDGWATAYDSPDARAKADELLLPVAKYFEAKAREVSPDSIVMAPEVQIIFDRVLSEHSTEARDAPNTRPEVDSQAHVNK